MAASTRKPRSVEELCALPDDAILLPAEAAALINSTERTLAVRRSRGQPPRYLKFGRAVRYRKGDALGCLTNPDDGPAEAFR